MELLFRLDVILLQLVIELFERLKVFNGHTHLFDPLSHLQVPLRKLLEHVLRTKCIIQLHLEIFYLSFGIGKLCLSQFERA